MPCVFSISNEDVGVSNVVAVGWEGGFLFLKGMILVLGDKSLEN